MLNKCMLIGFLGKDPELKEKGETKWVNFSLATSEKIKGEDVTEWHNVTAFNKTAENVAKYLKKGSKAFIEGKIQTDKYEKDGETRYATKIIAHRVQFLDSKKDGGGSDAQLDF